MTENSEHHSSRRRFVRRLVTLGAAGGIGALLSERVAEKPLIQLAQAASGDYLSMDNVNTATGTTELDSDLTTSGTDVAFKVVASATSGTMRGIYGESPSPDGRGVEGHASASVSTSGNAAGVYGRSDAVDTAGVRGIATAAGGTSPCYTSGVEGYASAGSGPVQGVYGHTDSPDGVGVWGKALFLGVAGIASGTSGETTGVIGSVASPDGTGVIGFSSGDGPHANGVWGGTWSTKGGCGVSGWAEATSGDGSGVRGQSDSPDGYGVEGYAAASVSASGNAAGVYGHTDAPNTAGVRGLATASSGSFTSGVEGHAPGKDGMINGVYGHTDSPSGCGVWGYGPSVGVVGDADSPGGAGVVGEAWVNDGVGVLGRSRGNASGVIPIVAQGASGQTAPLQEWQNYAGTPLAVVDKDGSLGIGTGSPARQLHIVGSNAVARMDRNVDSASFIFVRTNTDYSQVLKTFTFGVKATGVNNGSFFIGDMHTNVSGSSDNRLLIDTNGNVGIGTTTPSSKLHVAGRVKALGYDTGDITFANGYRVTEDTQSGLLFMNQKGEQIARLDEQGNFHVKGDIIKDL